MTSFSIAILAHNEAGSLPALLEDLRAQTIFDEEVENLSIDLFVVGNGCSDDTVAVARERMEELGFPDSIRREVIDIPVAGKTNAWNVFMQEILPKNTDFVCLMDADIRMPQRDLIARSLQRLEESNEVWVVSDTSVKDFTGVSRLNLMRQLNLAFEKPTNGRASICGQFYVARAERLSRIVLPIGLLSQDGFLRAMILTDALTRPEELSRIHVVPDAMHLHPAYTEMSRMVRFQKRQAIGTAIYRLIYRELEQLPPSLDVRMEEIRHRNAEDPDWVAGLIARRSADTRRFVPLSYVYRMALSARRTRGLAMLKWLLVPFGVAFDAWVAYRADAELRALAVGTVQANHGKFKVRR